MTDKTIFSHEVNAFVSEAHVHMASILHDYNHYFELQFIPQRDRDATDTKPWRIVDTTPGTRTHVIRWLSDEDMKNPAEVIAWIFAGDQSKNRPEDILRRIEAREAADKLMALKKEEDELGDRLEFGQYVFGDKSPNFMRHNGQVYRK